MSIGIEGKFPNEYGQRENKEKYLDIVLTYFKGEIKMMEDWLINPRIDKEDCITIASTECSRMLSYNIEDESKNLEDIIQVSTRNLERQLNISTISRWRYREEEMQQMASEQQQVCRNVVYQQKDKLEMEIEEMRMLMMKMS